MSDMTDQSDQADQKLVLTHVDDDGIATITINRPDKRNALNTAVLDALIEAFETVRDDEDARVVVLTGAGDKAFSAGGDLGSMPSGGMLGMHQDRGRFIDVIEVMAKLGKPIIARVNGHALGGGFGLLLACDLAIAAEDALLGTPEIRVGLFPMMIMALIFRNVGRKKGMELMLMGKRIPAGEAEQLGMLNRVVDNDDLDEAVAEMAGRIAGFSPAILKLGRDAFYHSADMDLWSALEYLRSQLTLNTMTEDAAEGVMAFLQKRDPKWKGR